MKRTLLISISLLFLLCLPLRANQDKVVLNFWEFSAGEGLMRSILDEFEQENPGIEVRLQQLTWEYGREKIITSIAAQNAPDVFELGTTWIPQFASSGAISDLTDYVTDIKDDYFLWEPVTYKERIYGAPWLAGTRVLFYNRNLFYRAGLDPDKPPQTWAELLDAAKKIDRLGEDIYGFGIFAAEPYAPWQEFLAFAWGNRGDVLSADGKTCLLNSPQVVEALEFYRQLKEFSIVDRQSQINTFFAEGKVGIQISGAWNLRLIPQLNPALNFDVALLPQPGNKQGFPAAFAGGEVFAVWKGSKHAPQAIKLIRFLIREKQIMAVVKAQRNVIPTVKASINHPYYDEHPRQRVFFEQMAHAVSPPRHPDWDEMEKQITRAIDEVVIKGAPPDTALDTASRNIQAIIDKQEIPARLSDKILAFIILGLLLLAMLAKIGTATLFPNNKLLKHKGEKSRGPYFSTLIFLIPWILTFCIFGLYPLVYSFILSLSKYNIFTSQFSFIGIRNYREILTDRNFLNAVWHTTFFAIGTIPFTTLIALFCANLLNRKIPFKSLYQTGLFIPVAASVIVIATIFSYIYAPHGPLHLILAKLGLPSPQPSWLMNTKWALPGIMIMNIWASFGYYTILFLAGMQTIPHSLYEAAAIDGANRWQQFRTITIPQLRPIILFVVVINTIRSFQVFPEIFTMTEGGPLGSTTTIVYYLYELGFHRFRMGEASAVGYILFAIILCLAVSQMKFFGMYEESDK